MSCFNRNFLCLYIWIWYKEKKWFDTFFQTMCRDSWVLIFPQHCQLNVKHSVFINHVWISCHVIIASIEWTFLIQSKTGFPPILDVCLDQFCQSIWLKSLFTSLDCVMLDSLSFSRYKRRSFLVWYCRHNRQLETVVMPSRSILLVSLFA